MVNFLRKEKYTFPDLVELTRVLRGEGGCPWDREQTHKSIRMNFIEETYEACEAIDTENPELLLEELGDVLAQVVFHAELEREAGRFNIDDVADGVCKKYIYRHPHVFGDATANTSDEVLSKWDELKRKEKNQETHFSALDSVARSLPSLMRAEKLIGKAEKAGYPAKSDEEIAKSISEELSRGESADIGKLLFDVAALARHKRINPEEALDLKNEEFLLKFKRFENK